MLPRPAFDNVLNSSVAYAVFFSQLSARYAAGSVFSTDADNGCVCQLGLPATLAISMAHLCAAVCPIVGVGSEEEVLRAHAGGIVARVEDMHSGRDRAEVNFPGTSVSSSASTQLPVTVYGFSADPQPASIGFFNFRPEPLDHWPALSGCEAPVPTNDAATNAATLTDFCRVNREGGTAHDAGAIDHTGNYTPFWWRAPTWPSCGGRARCLDTPGPAMTIEHLDRPGVLKDNSPLDAEDIYAMTKRDRRLS